MRNVIVILSLLVSMNSFAQQLTYSEFINLTKIEHWSNLNDVLTTKGFQYSGKKNEKAFWTKNCTHTEFNYDGSFNWNYNKCGSYSVLEIESDKTTSYKRYTYYFPFRTTYNSFIQAAKQNGFVFCEDQITDDIITASYTKHKNKNGLLYVEFLYFNSRKKGDYFIEYLPSVIFDDVDSTNSSQELEKHSQHNNDDSLNDDKAESEIHLMTKPQIHNLEGYSFEYCPLAEISKSGTLHIAITVSTDGRVIMAMIVGGTLTNNSRACKTCLSLAKMCRFRVPTGIKNDKDGFLTYTIK